VLTLSPGSDQPMRPVGKACTGRGGTAGFDQNESTECLKTGPSTPGG
jgi:hypothetical protein